jgi:hypothetical protein
MILRLVVHPFLLKRDYCRVAVMLPVSAAQPPEEAAGREYEILIPVPVICPVNVLALPTHWLGVAPVPVITPAEDTVPESKRGPKLPLVTGKPMFEKTPLVSVAVNVPAEDVLTPQVGHESLQLPV